MSTVRTCRLLQPAFTWWTAVSDPHANRPRHPYFTQIEVVAGLLGTLRLGFNPGELLDFILGWTTVDIFNDDRETREAKEQSNQ